jgi:DNA-binding transcriptional LysR family regulator
MSQPDWDHCRAFLAVLDTGSLSSAARLLGTAQPTVGRQIAAFEEALGGGSLFTRSPTGLEPTDLARALEPQARAMATAAEALARTASGEADDVRGAVRVTASTVIAIEVLPPILAGFQEQWPGTVIELSPSNEQEDLLHRSSDIAVRMARPTQTALVARKIGISRMKFYAHRSYLQRRGVPTSLRDLRDHTLIGYDRFIIPERFSRDAGFRIDRDLFAFRTDSESAQIAALRAGIGVCPCQESIAVRDPNLVPLTVDGFHWDLEVWVAMHEDLRSIRRMRLMFDALAEGMSDYLKAAG